MVDVVFLLLVFFLFSFELKLLEYRFQVGLTAQATDSVRPSPSSSQVWIAQVGEDTSRGGVAVKFAGETDASIGDLRELVGKMSTGNVVEIRAEPTIPYESVVKVASVFHHAHWDVRMR